MKPQTQKTSTYWSAKFPSSPLFQCHLLSRYISFLFLDLDQVCLHLLPTLAIGSQEAGQHIVAFLPQDVVHLAMLAAYVGQQWSLRLEHLVTHLALRL